VAPDLTFRWARAADLGDTTVELAAVRRLSRGWQFLTSYSATHSDAPFVNQSPYTPNAEINMASRYWEWNVKASGSFAFPYGVTASTNEDYRSGAPTARTVLVRGGQEIPSIVLNAEPVGSIHLPNTNLLDLRLEKKIKVPAGRRMLVRLNLYNALNANAATALNVRSGPAYLLPMAIVPPRILEFSASYWF
jgi:outer membrane receptor protein involved in Fe transport